MFSPVLINQALLFNSSFKIAKFFLLPALEVQCACYLHSSPIPYPYQARIHTGFHRFTEIGQIFHDKHF